ncbi:hypothetical protein SAMN05216540_11549 [Butyrivibrio sp. M55]|nr:hypothetical protein SAMN05216540_11549 [Butyrivibrio sp. M55]
MSKVIDAVDVICQHKYNGEIIPIRFRLMNEDGEYENYTIKGYRNISHPGPYTTPDNLYVSSSTYIFECIVVVLNSKKRVRLYFETRNCKWRIAI